MAVRHQRQTVKDTDKNWISTAAFIVLFDYNVHPANADQYGANLDWAALRAYFQKAKPDLVLIHSLGFWGWSTYQSKFAPSPKNMRFGYVERFKQLCDEENIRLGFYVASWFMGDFALEIAGHRPFSAAEKERWFIVNADGQRDPFLFCPNSPFAEEYLLPYCLESMERFSPAAFWFDHSRTKPCFCGFCRDKYRRVYKTEMPATADGNRIAKLNIFSDDSLIAAMQNISRELYKKNPELVISWAKALDPITLRPLFYGTDWIAADVTNAPNLHQAQFFSAYWSTIDVPASILSPDVARYKFPRQRPLETIYAEASTVLAHGGGASMYHMPKPLGEVGLDKNVVAARLAEFVRARSRFCPGNKSLPHVGVLASRAQNFRLPNRFRYMEKYLPAIYEILSQSHIPCDIVNDDLLLKRLESYALLVLPELQLVSIKTAEALLNYVRNGGRVFIIGRPPAVADAAEVKPDIPRIFDCDHTVGARTELHFTGERVVHLGQLVYPRILAGFTVVIRRLDTQRAEHEPLLIKKQIGKGEIYWFLANAVTEWAGETPDVLGLDALEKDAAASLKVDDIGEADQMSGQVPQSANDKPPAPGIVSGSEKERGITLEMMIDYMEPPFKNPATTEPIPHPHLRRFLGESIQLALGGRRLIRTNAPPGVEIVVNPRGADLYVHLVNHTFGFQPPANYYLTDCIPVLADIEFEINLPARPAGIEALPAGELMAEELSPNVRRITLARLHYHTAVRFAEVVRRE